MKFAVVMMIFLYGCSADRANSIYFSRDFENRCSIYELENSQRIDYEMYKFIYKEDSLNIYHGMHPNEPMILTLFESGIWEYDSILNEAYKYGKSEVEILVSGSKYEVKFEYADSIFKTYVIEVGVNYRKLDVLYLNQNNLSIWHIYGFISDVSNAEGIDSMGMPLHRW